MKYIIDLSIVLSEQLLVSYTCNGHVGIRIGGNIFNECFN